MIKGGKIMNQQTRDVVDILKSIIDEQLDCIQENEICQGNREVMYYLGEAIASLDNAIDVLENKR